jgi:membrane protein DedA with SNARE-associated domain
MADPLFAIASIVGIAAAAASLANTVYKFSDNIEHHKSLIWSEFSYLWPVDLWTDVN